MKKLSTPEIIAYALLATGLAVALASGFWLGRSTAPAPCIKNFAEFNLSFYSTEQDMLGNHTTYKNSDMTPDKMIREVIALSAEKDPEHATQIVRTEMAHTDFVKEFLVPSYCEVLKVDSLGDVVLVRKR